MTTVDDTHAHIHCSVCHTYNITLLREVSVTEALWSHPLDGQFDDLSTATVLSEVVPLKHILRQTKVCDLDQEVCVNPSIRVQVRVLCVIRRDLHVVPCSQLSVDIFFTFSHIIATKSVEILSPLLLITLSSSDRVHINGIITQLSRVWFERNFLAITSVPLV